MLIRKTHSKPTAIAMIVNHVLSQIRIQTNCQSVELTESVIKGNVKIVMNKEKLEYTLEKQPETFT